jgi:hypothetical protein
LGVPTFSTAAKIPSNIDQIPSDGALTRLFDGWRSPNARLLRGASLGEVEARTGPARFDGGRYAVVMVAINSVRRSRHSAKAVAAGHRRVFTNRKAALIAAQPIEWDVAREKSGIVKHDVLSGS